MSQRLAAWKARLQPRELELSGGLTVLIRPVELQNLVIGGGIPLTLLKQMQAVKPQKDGTYRDEDAVKLAGAIDAVVLAAVVDPKVTKAGDDDSIAIDDIPYSDRVRIFEEVNRPAAALQSFRGQPNGDAGAASGGEDLPPAAE
jgi:hypothetical protein